MKKIAWEKLIASIALCETVGGLGAIATFGGLAAWYATLVKPPLTPPAWIFSPVWTILYFLMGISLYRVWKKGFRGQFQRCALFLFFVQLALNFLWSVLFFGFHQPGFALFEILVLWCTIAAVINYFFRIDVLSAYLLIPYLLWVSFAVYLNYGVWVLNR